MKAQGPGTTRSFTLTLSSSTAGLIGSRSHTLTFANGPAAAQALSLPITGATSFAALETLTRTLTNTSGAGNQRIQALTTDGTA